jgi:hypothetical protein
MRNVNSTTMMKVRRSLMVILLLATACSSQVETPRAANPNRFIYVTSENLSEQCYRDLGPINVTEPFAEATVDQGDSTMEKRLRTLAMQQYPRDVDAVVGVHSNDNEAGTAVTVTGEAVEVEDHTTPACVLRGMPPLVDSAARTAAGGILGAVAGGLVTGTPQGAEGAGYFGAAGTATLELAAHRQKEMQHDQAVHDELADQRQTIARLQDERAQLNECKEEEIPLDKCGGGTQPASNPAAAPDNSDEPDWNASRFDLEKQSQMQQDYIAKLRVQIGDIKQEMQVK